MKTLIFILSLFLFSSCGGSDSLTQKKKVVCGDSIVQKMYDVNGDVYTAKLPGKCDTVEIKE
ncbi:MAG TPA: hypothetical protein PLQ93_05555 [Bacteroidia bacterium]|nr:hypothetical protein [Bacteroidia bacterium]